MVSETVLVVVNVLASITAMYMCMSPAPAMHQIYKRRCTGHMPVLPIVAQWAYNHVWMLYGYLTKSYFPLLVTYAVGNLLSVAFLAIFFYATAHERRSHVAQLIAMITLFNAATTCYAFLGPHVQQTHQVVQITGFVAIGCGLALYASPFATIALVIRTRNAISIPIGMVVVGTISNATWIVYGVLVHDLIIVCPTIVNTCLGVAQILLYVAYRPPSRRKQAALSEVASESLSDSTFPGSSSGSSSEQELSFVVLETPRGAHPTQTVADMA